MFVNGNMTTALMHLLTYHELQTMRVNQKWPIQRITSEKAVMLDFSRHNDAREGKFDFYVETPQKTIGFEVLTRPTKGKILKKMVYKDEVDEFVFVIPHDALLPYQQTENNHGWKVRPRFLPKEFGQKGLYVWLVDLDEKRITVKQPFTRLYNVDANGHAPKSGKKSAQRR